MIENNISFLLNQSIQNFDQLYASPDGCFTGYQCAVLCESFQINMIFTPFILLGLSIMLTYFAWYISENYDDVKSKFPSHVKTIQMFHSFCMWGSLICQFGLGFWVIYLKSSGIL